MARSTATVLVCVPDYVAWHEDAERRYRRGERSAQCAACARWYWPKVGHECSDATVSPQR